MSNIDQEFVEYVVKSLVSKPEAVIVERSIDEKGVLLLLTVDPEDLGRVIGKRGNTAQSIRTLLRALGTKNDARYNLKIVDNGEAKPERGDSRASQNGGSDAPVEVEETTVAAVSPWAHLSSSNDDDDDESGASDDDSDDKASDDSASAGSEESMEESVVEKTKKELADLDDLDI